jgi:serine protease AprX
MAPARATPASTDGARGTRARSASFQPAVDGPTSADLTLARERLVSSMAATLGTAGDAHRGAPLRPCPLCGSPTAPLDLAEAGWVTQEVEERLVAAHPHWRRPHGACPACVQHALLETLLARGDAALHLSVQRVWPLDAEAAFGALPTPLRLHADPRYTGRGITVAVIDAAFSPHPDLTRPRNRIRAWVDAARDPAEARYFAPDEMPSWPGAEAREPGQWHGLMTSAVLAGGGWSSHGLYCGVAPDAELVLVQVRDAAGRITSAAIARALRWLLGAGGALGVRVVNVSLGAEPVPPGARSEVDAAVAEVVEAGAVVVAAAGNDGRRQLVPPGTAPAAITVGGLDDRNVLDHAARTLWHSNYGEAADGAVKPELVAPSIWVVAPILTGTDVAQEAAALFARRSAGDGGAEERIAALKLVTPHYQHVEGTSFASPLAAGVVACMLEANGALGPAEARELLVQSAHAVPGAPIERQGAGALDAGRAVALALASRDGSGSRPVLSPVVEVEHVRFLFRHDTDADTDVRLVASWDAWARPGVPLRRVAPGRYEAVVARPAPGTHAYKLVIGADRWLADPANSARAHDGFGGWNSLLRIAAPTENAAARDATSAPRRGAAGAVSPLSRPGPPRRTP